MRKLGTVLITAVGLLLVAQTLYGLASLASGGGFARPLLGTPYPWSLVVQAVPGIIGLLVIGYRYQLAALLFRDSESDVAVDPVALMRVGLVLLGLWLAVQALSTTLVSLGFILSFVMQRGSGFPGPLLIGLGQLFSELLASIIPTVVTGAFGLWFVFRSERIAERLISPATPDREGE